MNYLGRLYCVLLTVSVAVARCPDLTPPRSGVLKCQISASQELNCTATCSRGFTFHGGQPVQRRRCAVGAQSWSGGPTLIPDCYSVHADNCNSSLLGKGDKRITVSSSQISLPLNYLLSQTGSWQPEQDNILQFIQVDLGSLHKITGLTIKGDGNGSYVSLFRLLFSKDGAAWAAYNDGRVFDKFFSGSLDSLTSVSQNLSTPQTARYVRLNPLSWNQHIALQWDLKGCPIEQATASAVCKFPRPPQRGALNCWKNGTDVLCAAYCQQGLVFQGQGPALDLTCDPQEGHFTHTPLPECVERNTTQGPDVNITGQCMQGENDCFHAANGDYQFCGDCHYYSTCSENNLYVRPCPGHLRFDSSRRRCEYNSTTCFPKRRLEAKRARLRAIFLQA